MKEKKNTENAVAIAEALKAVKAAMAKVDEQKAVLKTELDAVLKEEARRREGKKSFIIGSFMNKDSICYVSDEELARKRITLKEGLQIPYWADAEFRKCSLVYLELIIEESKKEYEANDKMREENYQTLINYRKRRDELSSMYTDIGAKYQKLFMDIGLSEFARGMIHGAPWCHLGQYKDVCAKYE